MLGKLILGNIAARLASSYKPRRDLTLGDAVAELKYLVSELNTFAIVSPSSRDVTILKEIIAVVDGMDIPEIIGNEDGKA